MKITAKKNNNIEIYTKKWCPYCRKAKAFLKSKGLSFEEHNVDNRDKLMEMIERSDRKTVPQIFINKQHIGGYDDLIEKERSGELNKMLRLPDEDLSNQLWDLIIIGGGPAGINAALYGARKGVKVLLISRDVGGQVVDTEEIGNYIGLKDANGAQLINAFWEHAHQYDIKSVIGENVEEIIHHDMMNPGFDEKIHLVKTDNAKEYRTKTVIIASGTRNRRLGMKQEYVLAGQGIHYCAICDGFKYAGRPVAIVGGGNSGLEAALDLAKLDCHVSLIEIQDKLMGDQFLQDKVYDNDKIEVFTSTGVGEIIGKDKLESVIIKGRKDSSNKEFKKKLNVEALFVEIGLEANTDFIKELLELNDRKEIVINENNESSVEGIWAAGDVTDIKDKQIVISAAEGAKATLRVNEYLMNN